MNNMDQMLEESVIGYDVVIDSICPLFVIKIERDCGELECQLWIDENSGAVVSIRFIKDEWEGYLYRLDKVTYCKHIPEDIISRFFKVVEHTIVDEIDKTLMKESYAPIRGFKKYFYAHIVESKDYWFKKHFPGISNENPTLLVYKAS